MYKGIIFDLDQTIIDSTIAEVLRKQRVWNKVYPLIPSFKLYQGFGDVFSFILTNKIRCCIVTTSPGTYANRVISHFRIPCEFVLDYFSTTNKKPHPDPMAKALELFKLKNQEVISFGDRAMDIYSSNSASIKSVACTWGTNEKDALFNAHPSLIINHPSEIIPIIKNLKSL
jgi:phosphoglycolate phosphatase-like HAD superfamily hydrolase